MAYVLDPYVLLTAWTTMFVCWVSLETMERKFGMAPIIVTDKTMKMSATNCDNPMKQVVTNIRMTKSLDKKKGKFRMQVRGAIYFTKCGWSLIMHIVSLLVFILNGKWFMDHFIYLDAETVSLSAYQHISVSILVFYPWEVAANRYGKLEWSTIAHHFVASLAALAILLGRYTPYATWYGFAGISMGYPLLFALGFRAQFANEYPAFTRKMLVCVAYDYGCCCCVVNISGQVFLLLNALIWHPGKVHLSVTIPMAFAICTWIYDDWKLLKALFAMSKMDYEMADVLCHKCETVRVQGKEIFGLSVLTDIIKSEERITVPSMNTLNQISLHKIEPVRDDHVAEEVQNDTKATTNETDVVIVYNNEN
eukprot:952369_1